MKAAIYHRYGAPDVVRIEEIAEPTPGDNDILVRVLATSVNAADWRFRRASPFLVRIMNGLFAPKRIKVLGLGFAGRVAQLGKNVKRLSVGDLVFGSAGLKFGAHAEYVCVTEPAAVQLKPANASIEDSAGILFGGVSALHFLRAAKIRPGQNVLVYGASGAVGVNVVQLAKHYGARVTAVCSGANVDLVRGLGADRVIDYTKEDFADGGRIYDVIVDTVGHCEWAGAMRSLKRGGVLALVYRAAHAPFGARTLAQLTGAAKIITGMAQAQPGDTDLLKQLVETGALRPVTGLRYPFAQIADAHAYAESGHKVGNVIVTLDEADNV